MLKGCHGKYRKINTIVTPEIVLSGLGLWEMKRRSLTFSRLHRRIASNFEYEQFLLCSIHELGSESIPNISHHDLGHSVARDIVVV